MKKLEQLLSGINYVASEDISNVVVDNIAHDSRNVGYGDCFIALQGVNGDGVNYVSDAVNNGASVIVAGSKNIIINIAAIIIYVDNTRATLAIMAANYYDNPAKNLKMVGVVGTNGKTSCARILSNILDNCGYKSASIGTLGAEYNGIKCVTGMTTPDPMQLNKILRDMVRDMVEYVVVEVSAHAIYLCKTSGIIFDCLLYTNITQDHLDYFVTMERYSATKLGFFTKEHAKFAVINGDDKYATKLLHDTNLDTTVYSIDAKSQYFAADIKYKTGTSFNLFAEGNNYIIKSKLAGKFNVYNLLGAIAALRNLGVDMDKIIKSIPNIKTIDGRCNAVTADSVTYLIDYAHTPDGLKNIIETAIEMAKGRVIVLFGCGGDRDKSKRPIMGNLAARLADKVIITSDNSRSEEPHKIIEEILGGIEDMCGNILVCPDRRHAIKQAVHMSQSGDIVIIAGKGAEEFIEVGEKNIPFNDLDVLKEILGDNCD